jgi:hypothetical protein
VSAGRRFHPCRVPAAPVGSQVHVTDNDLPLVRACGGQGALGVERARAEPPHFPVKPQFLSYVLVTDAGRILTGMITAETANSITIRRADGTAETVLRVRIHELRSTGLSFMPEGLEKQIDVPTMADLLAYLNSIK